MNDRAELEWMEKCKERRKMVRYGGGLWVGVTVRRAIVTIQLYFAASAAAAAHT